MSAAGDDAAVEVAFFPRVADLPDSLWRACFPAPLEGRFWYETLESGGLEDQFVFRYGLLTRGGTPIGIAPCFRHDVPMALVAPAAVAWGLRQLARVFRGADHQRTFFVGSPCSDEGTIGLGPGVALTDVIGPLRKAVRAEARALGARMIVFKDFGVGDLPGLTAPGGGGRFVPTVSYPGTVLKLPPPDKEAYYRSLSHQRRHNLLKKLRRSREALPIDVTVVAEPSDTELGDIFGLFGQTYERGKTKFERLDRAFFDHMRRQPPARFILLRDRATGALVAFMLVFRLGDRVINKFIGLDYARAGNAYLYFRLFDAAVDFSYAEGARELQSGQTGYRAKLDLGHELVPLHNVFRHENPLVHAVFAAIGRRVTWQSLDADLATYLRAHAAGRE